MMKYRYIKTRDTDESYVVVEDGGIAYTYSAEGLRYITMLYQSRITDCPEEFQTLDEVNEWLDQNSKIYLHDWPDGTKPTRYEIEAVCRDWLVCPEPEDGWQHDDELFNHLFE